MTIAANTRLDGEARMEAYTLLHEFYLIIGRIHPSMWDRTMTEFMVAPFDDSYRPNVGPLPVIREPIARDYSRAFVSNRTNTSRGTGMPTPAFEQTMDQDAMGRYVLLHGRPGSANPYLGVVMNHAYHIHRRSLFGYSLGRMLAPTNARSRGAFMRLFATLTALPFRYADAVIAHNQNNPGAPMHPQAGPTYRLEPLVIDHRHAWNMTIEDIIEALIHNRIPTEWVDHAYLYGLQFMDLHYHGAAIDRALLDEQDNEHLHRLDQRGIPPAIPAWDGWRRPTEDEILRLNTILDVEEQRGTHSLEAPGWLAVGQNPFRRYLTRRPRSEADAGVAALRAHLVANTATTTATATTPPQPTPAIASASTLASTSGSGTTTVNAVAGPALPFANMNDTTLDDGQDTIMGGALDDNKEDADEQAEVPLSPLSETED
jgi:hypothetical protein